MPRCAESALRLAGIEDKPMFKPRQAVIITHAAGKSEAGRIVRADRQSADWYTVRFDVDGAKLCVAATSLQLSPAPPGFTARAVNPAACACNGGRVLSGGRRKRKTTQRPGKPPWR
jgi:hypothetical protein